jgi:TonB family protein
MSGAGERPRTRRGRRSRARALFALGAALGAHALILAALRYVDLGDDARLQLASALPISSSADDSPLEISSLVDSLSALDAPTAAEKKQQEKTKKEEESKDIKGQVVDLARPALEQRPDEARFLSEYDSKVDHERRGKAGHDKAGAQVPATPPPSAPQGEAAATEATRGGAAGKAGEPRPALAMARPNRTGHDGHEADADGTFKSRTGAGMDRTGHSSSSVTQSTGPVAQSQGQRGEDGDGRPQAAGAQKGASVPNLNLSRESFDRAIGAGSGSVDYLKDLDDGDSTALNAKKFKHAPFFNRLKRAVAQEWHPDMVYVRHDPSGNVYGVKDRVTVLRVHIRPDGGLVGTNVVQSSGIDFLDDEAIESFRRAQPFQNPPRDLIDSDGQIHFSFAFIFELSGQTSFKVYKYR